jgi:TolA-binding protein
MKNTKINFTRRNCIIGYSWLIVTVFVLSLLISSCGSPNSVRSQYRKIKDKTDETKKHYYLDEEKETVFPATLEKPNYTSENDLASNDIKSGSSPKIKIASLREQMKIYTEEQSVIKNKITNIETDISDIKTTLTEIKENINPNKNLQTAIAGDYNQDNIALEAISKSDIKKPLTILSDEATYSKISKKKENPTPSIEKKKKLIPKSIKIENIDANEKAKLTKNNVIKANEQAELNSKKIDQKSDIELALSLMKQKKYETAIVEFNRIALGSKSNQVITSCNYWIGESYFSQNQFDKAAQSFQRVLRSTANFRKDNAQMLLAECYTKIGKTDNAKLACQSLIDNYPKSIYVPKAKKMLQTL